VRYKNTQNIVDFNGKEIKASTYGKAWINPYEHFKDQDKLDVENYARYILWVVAGGITFWLTASILTNKTVMPVVFIFLAFQQFFYIGCQDIYLGQKLSYFFTFFRIFRLEHSKLTYLFVDYKLIDLPSLSKQVDYNQNFWFLSEF